MVFKILFAMMLSITVVFSQSFWERTEPYYASFNKMYFGGGDTIYGTLSSGFSRSTNNGSTWSAPVIVNYVTDIAVAPNGYIFLSENQQKMSRSTNKGVSWTIKGTGINEPSCSAVMVTSTGVVITGTNRGIYRSTDNGDNWTKVAGSAEMSGDTSVTAMATFDGNTLYAFTRTTTINPERGYAFRSTNNGLTWTKGTNSLDTVAFYKATVSSGGTIYVRTGNGVRYSTDGGNTWGILGFYNDYIGDVATDLTGAVYAAINSKDTSAVLYKTTNNGTTWQSIKTPYTGISGFGINKKGDLFLSQDQLYRSTDNGNSWKALPVSYPNVGTMIESPKHELFVTAGGNAYQNLYRSSDFGQSWNIIYTGVVGVPSVGFYGDTILVGDNYYIGSMYRSTDNAKTFKPLANNIGLGGYVSAIFGTSYNSILAGTSNGIYRSTNTTKSWVKVHSSSVNSLHQSPNGTLFARRQWPGDGIYRSIDSGSTWQQKITGMSVTTVRSLDIAPNGDLIAGTEGGIFRSTDNAENWVRIDSQKVVKPYGIFAAVNKSGKIFMGGAKSGINSQCYQSTNNGATWEQIENNILTIDANSSLTGLFAASNGHLFGGTTYGLFKSTQITTSVSKNSNAVPGLFSLFQNYPNPFNPTTVLQFTIREAGMISLRVYDILGKEVATLVNEVKEAGSYSISFNATTLSGGMYVARLQNGSKTETKKMLLIK